MKLNRFLLCLLILPLLSNTCQKDDTTTPIENESYLIFGHYFGHCVGEQCIEIYKLDANSLSEDDKDQYPSTTDFYKGDFAALDDALFEETKDILAHFPIDLLEETETTLGLPDAGDWGGFYVEYKTDDVHRFWLLDKNRNGLPKPYHDFADRMEKKITVLSQ